MLLLDNALFWSGSRSSSRRRRPPLPPWPPFSPSGSRRRCSPRSGSSEGHGDGRRCCSRSRCSGTRNAAVAARLLALPFLVYALALRYNAA
jgi:hypothetical protein